MRRLFGKTKWGRWTEADRPLIFTLAGSVAAVGLSTEEFAWFRGREVTLRNGFDASAETVFGRASASGVRGGVDALDAAHTCHATQALTQTIGAVRRQRYRTVPERSEG